MDSDVERDASPQSGRNLKTRGRRGNFSRVLAPVQDWFRSFGLDILTLIVLGLLALMGDKYVPAVGGETRYFRLLPEDAVQFGSIDHPDRPQIISFWLSAGLDIAIPAGTIAFLQLFHGGSFFEASRAVVGVLTSVIVCCFFQVIMKILIGGFRPAFLEVCKPDPSLAQGSGWDGTYYQSNICTTPDKSRLSWTLESFPSGHVATAFAAGVFLTLYINARLKVFADYRANPAVMVFCLYPLCLSMLMAGAISIDMSHHWYDIIGGAILGSFIALLSFKNVYAAVWDHRRNHIPLPNSRRLSAERLATLEERNYSVHVGFPVFHKEI